ncbi:MAG: hypothetical protein HYU03_06525 [Thaumarchaeota archaeon]|nr:hypothetical protein [Nitrososphaerota archaeon]MCS4540324.1 hypothetical protein [Nitrososphaerota archaeon]
MSTTIGKKVLVSVGLVVFATGLYMATFGITYAGSGLTFLGALVSIFGLMQQGKEAIGQLGVRINSVKSSDKK